MERRSSRNRKISQRMAVVSDTERKRVGFGVFFLTSAFVNDSPLSSLSSRSLSLHHSYFFNFWFLSASGIYIYMPDYFLILYPFTLYGAKRKKKRMLTPGCVGELLGLTNDNPSFFS